MSEKIKNIKKFYDMGLYTKAKIKILFNSGKITSLEYELIVGEPVD